MLIFCHFLTQKQLNDLEALKARAIAHDGNHIPLYTHLLTHQREEANTLLYYENQVLIGFLSLFFFEEDAYEVVVLTDPKHRKQGIAKTLLKNCLALKENIYQKLIFPTVMTDIPFESKGFVYQYADYKLALSHAKKIELSEALLNIRLATPDDIIALAKIDKLCFKGDYSEMLERFGLLLNDPSYVIFVAEIDKEIIGKVHLRLDKKGVFLSDLSILPKHQHKGYGTTLLSYCVNHHIEFNHTPLFLHVETSNHYALKLYQNLGFEIINETFFWEISKSHSNSLFKENN